MSRQTPVDKLPEFVVVDDIVFKASCQRISECHMHNTGTFVEKVITLYEQLVFLQ